MSGLFNIAGRHQRSAPAIAGLRVQSSVYGLPIPIVYGKARVAGNLIHMLDYRAALFTDKAPRGKILGIPVKTAEGGSTWRYFAAVALALAEGVIIGIDRVWVEKEAPEDFSTVYAGAGWELFNGTETQSPWAFISSFAPSEAVPYQFTAYVAHENLELPNSALLNYSWEVFGAPFSVSIPDVSPAVVVPDLLENERYGVGFPSSKIGDTTLWAEYCAAAGLFASPVIGGERPAREHIEELLEVSNTAAVWSDGEIKWKPYGDTTLTGNGETYTPDVTPVYDLTDNDFLPRGEDVPPLRIRRRDSADVPNMVTVEIHDRDFDYNPTPYKAEDLASQIQNGQRPLAVLALHSIKSQDVARTVAQLRLQREQNIRNTYEFRVGMKYSLLEPMDLVTLTDSRQGLSLVPVRITEITELEGEAGFDMKAEDFPLGTASASLYGSQGANGFAPDTNVAPGSTIARVLEPPTEMLQTPLDLWCLATGGANWGGCEVYMSLDGTNYTWVGRISSKAAFGETTASLATDSPWPAVDSTHTLAVDISQSVGRTLRGYTTDEFQALEPIAKVDGEWVGFRDATLTGTGLYDLEWLYRGLFGSTIPASHSSGVDFSFIDSAVLAVSVPWQAVGVGSVVRFKFPAFNQYGQALQDLSSVSAVPITLTRDPIFVGNAIPQATVSVNADGSYAISVEGPEWMRSAKWAVSTSGFPSEATVLASGTTTNGRTFTITGAAASLALTDTIYATVIPYRGASASGFKGQSIRARGTYQDFSATKTIRFSGASLMPLDQFSAAHFEVTSYYVAPTGTVNSDSVFLQMLLPLPDGVTITDVSAAVHNTSAGAGPKMTLVRVESDGTGTALNTPSATAGTGWQTWQETYAEDTTGRGYIMGIWFDMGSHAADEADFRFASVDVTFEMSSAVHSL